MSNESTVNNSTAISRSGNTAMLNDDAQTKITGILVDKAEIDMSTYYTYKITPQARAQKRGETFIAAGFTFRNEDTEETQKEIWSDLYNDIAEQIYRADIRESENTTQPTNTSTQPGGSTITGTGVGTGTDLEFVKIAAKNAATRDAQVKANVKGGKVDNITVVSEEPQLLSVIGTWKVTTTVRGTFIEKQTVQDKYPRGYKVTNITFEYTQVDPDRPKSETPTPSVTPAPVATNTELKQTRYLPEFSYTKPKSTSGGELVVKKTGDEYKGTYIKTTDNKYYSGDKPEDNGEELVDITPQYLEDLQPLVTNIPGLLKGFFKFKPKKGDSRKGITQRFFIQPKTTQKISEVDLDTYTQAQNQLVNYNFAQVDWNIKGPAEDTMFNGYPYEGAASKNKKAIQALESQMPGISTFITNYSELVEEPVSKVDTALQSQIIKVEDPLTELDNSRKANFDLRK